MTVRISLLSKIHAEEILEFENENRAFFESVISPRPESYYDLENIKAIIEGIEKEHENDICYMYIIRNEEGKIVGRINLFSIERGMFQKAEVGYRIGEKYNGRGYATEALALVCREAFDKHKLHRIEAGTSRNNIGSQVVLVKNAFEFIGRTRKVIKINGVWEDGVLFEKVNEDED